MRNHFFVGVKCNFPVFRIITLIIKSTVRLEVRNNDGCATTPDSTAHEKTCSPACQMDGCNVIIVIQYSCILFQSPTKGQYFGFTDCRFYLINCALARPIMALKRNKTIFVTTNAPIIVFPQRG